MKNPQAKAAVEWQAPLGPNPSYDDLVDHAVDNTFPCSDPIAVGSCCGRISRQAPAGGAPGEDPPGKKPGPKTPRS